MNYSEQKEKAFRWFLRQARERNLPLNDAAAIVLPFFPDLNPEAPLPREWVMPTTFLDPANPFPRPNERPHYKMLDRKLFQASFIHK